MRGVFSRNLKSQNYYSWDVYQLFSTYRQILKININMSFSRFYIIPLLLTICFSLSAEDKFGDYATRKYSVIPPSPEVASMMKYVDIPVSYFTGQPQIEIPIYTITEGSLSVPISLSYKGGGIKQNELPGVISSGW